MTEDSQLKFRSFAHAALRIAADSSISPPVPPNCLAGSGGFGLTTAPPTSRLVSEWRESSRTVCGLGLILGLFPPAGIASGEMAIASLLDPLGRRGISGVWQNSGEMVISSHSSGCCSRPEVSDTASVDESGSPGESLIAPDSAGWRNRGSRHSGEARDLLEHAAEQGSLPVSTRWPNT